MIFLKTKCNFCGKEFLKSKRRVNEAKKFGWKFYCSLTCQYKAKRRRKTSNCANPACGKKVSRFLNQFKKSKTKRFFCSTSCSAIYHNESRKKYKVCSMCDKKFYGGHKYCSMACYIKAPNPKKIPLEQYKQKVISDIITFYNKNKRIPVKKEMYGHYRTTRKLFGTWNKAIIAAGLKPNPVRFSIKYTAQDGHLCDSFAEKIIDDILYAKNIKHVRNFFYPNSRYTADFKVGNRLIEFFGLLGEIKEYDRNVIKKSILEKKYNLKIIKIYPKDLFPIEKLSNFLYSSLKN